MESSYTSNLSHVPSSWGNIPNPCPASVSGTTFLIIAYSAVSAVGLIGNSCLVYVITRQKEMRNVTNVFIANLSCSDILMCIVCLPATIIYTLMDHWVLGEALCKVTPFVQCTSVTVSIFSLVLIAMERYQLIIHPTGWKPAVSRSYQAVGVTWLVALLISLPFLCVLVLDSPFQDMGLPIHNQSVPFHNLSIPFHNLSVPFDHSSVPFDHLSIPFHNLSLPLDHLVCVEQWSSNDSRLAYFTALLLFQYLLPLALILVCYLRIFLRLKRRNDMVERGGDAQQKKTKGSRKINAMLGSIVVAFALCWLPLTVFNTVFDWYHEAVKSCQHDAIFSACHLTAMASTCVNPVIYGFLNGNFQKQLKSTLLRCRCWGAGERYESFPLSILSTEVTKGSLLSKGSISINT